MCSQTLVGNVERAAPGSQPSASFVAAHLVRAERSAVRLRRCRPRAARRSRCACGRRSSTAAPSPRCAAAIAARSASRSFASSTCCTCQPCASKRAPRSSRERDRRRAVDRDVVVVVEVDELAEPERARRSTPPRARRPPSGRRRSRCVDAVVDDLVVRPVEALGEEALGDRHADAVREALAERARRRLDPGRVASAPGGPA